MTIVLDLAPDAEARLQRRASREGKDAQTVALRLLTERLTEDEEEELPGSRSMANLFIGRVGLVAGSGEAYSENGGQRFAEGLARKHGQ